VGSFVVAGESLVDIVVPADGGPRHNAVGGSCLNVAVGLARLDVPTTLVTRIGDDELMKGVRYRAGGASTHSLVMRSRSGTIRSITSEHKLQKLSHYAAVDFGH
jgi:sugar/nucleoside kinase (ribokinase family)